MKKYLVIIAGAAGEIGSWYSKTLSDKGIEVIAIVRNKKLPFISPLISEIICHLDNKKDIESKFNNISIEDYQEIIYLHTIGVDKFDPRGYPDVQPMETIDPEVYATNVNSFKYLMRYLIQRIGLYNKSNKNNTQLKIAMIGGVADKHAPFVIESFCEAKYIIRQYIQSQVNIHPEWVSGLSINVTSTLTKSALEVRPHADTKYWLKPNEVVERSIEILLANFTNRDGYAEIDIIKELPHFIQGYYENDQMLYDKWSRETGIN